ncbi:MAG: hypothetical protein GY799_15165 [Desulfobulbaceae bacterium]|nr:hypothetical protein [Desulfobulbaceae bacterium]
MGTAAAIAGSVGLSSGLSYLGAETEAEAAEKAGALQYQASQEALGFQKEQYGEAKERMDPFIQGGAGAYQQQQALSGALGPQAQEQAYADFRESPGVQFQREQGETAINRQAAATGGFGGATRLKELSRFNQGLAEQSINNRFNQLGAITGTGLGAAQALSGIGSAAGAGMAQTVQSGAAAQGQATMAAGAARGQFYSDMGQQLQSGLGFMGGAYG